MSDIHILRSIVWWCGDGAHLFLISEEKVLQFMESPLIMSVI